MSPRPKSFSGFWLELIRFPLFDLATILLTEDNRLVSSISNLAEWEATLAPTRIPTVPPSESIVQPPLRSSGCIVDLLYDWFGSEDSSYGGQSSTEGQSGRTQSSGMGDSSASDSYSGAK